MRLPAPARVATYIQPPASDCVRSIDRDLGASRVVGGVAGRWRRRRRPIPTNQASAYACAFCWFASATCDASGARGGFCRRRERTADTTAARPMHPAPCSAIAILCVCLHQRVWQRTYSLQPATACDRSGARGQSCRRRGGKAMAAAATYPGTDARSTYAVLTYAFACTTLQ